MKLPTDTEISSHRPIIGRLIVAYKKFIRALINPYLRTVFEAERRMVDGKLEDLIAVLLNRKLDDVNLRLSLQEDISRDLVKRMDSIAVLLNRKLDDISKNQDEMDSIAVLLNRKMDDISKNQDEMDCKYEAVHNRIETLRYRFEDGLTVNARDSTLRGFAGGEGARHGGIDYLDFENRFRGKREDIKKRLSIYLSVFGAMPPSDYILDIGCGRGEFLELLKENSIKGKGIDANSSMVSYCKDIGLDVTEANAAEYLPCTADNAIGGVMASHLIEHLSVDDLITLAKACHRKLKPGGSLIFETPNPTCLTIFSGAFYVDPTHVRPVHPELARYVLEKAGFGNIEIWFVNQSGDRLSLKDSLDKELEFINENFRKINPVLFGAPDYAVLARKAG